MKKVFYSIAIVSAMMFASCGEDRGTTTEVANANVDEDVNPNHIRGYGDEASHNTAGMSGDADLGYRQEAEQVASRMASDLKLDQPTQTKVQQVYYDRAKRMGELEDRYNYSETNRMGGQANNDTENDMSDNPNTNMDATRPNNANNAYTGNNNEGEGLNANAANNKNQNAAGTSGNNMSNDMSTTGAPMTQSQMESEQKKIMQDTDRQMKEVLTPEQYKQWQQNKSKYTNKQPESSSQNKSGDNMQKKNN
ncbi:hypothetical protein [Pontibacter ruber]|uniref:Lipoprotein n=1 Tax=Pontibacter ruber TaxID=1343895 RepID=A0ABW5D372_9BACT|nr:hypothetical protein [Pontibacter ruber]